MTRMSKEIRDKNLDHAQEILLLKDTVILPNLSSILQLVAYGFQDGHGEADLKDVPHFGIGVINNRKRFTAYLFLNYEDVNKIPEEKDVIELIQKAEESFKNYRIPLTKRKRRGQVRRTIFILNPNLIREDVENIVPF